MISPRKRKAQMQPAVIRDLANNHEPKAFFRVVVLNDNHTFHGNEKDTLITNSSVLKLYPVVTRKQNATALELKAKIASAVVLDRNRSVDEETYGMKRDKSGWSVARTANLLMMSTNSDDETEHNNNTGQEESRNRASAGCPKASIPEPSSFLSPQSVTTLQKQQIVKAVIHRMFFLESSGVEIDIQDSTPLKEIPDNVMLLVYLMDEYMISTSLGFSEY
eukprot:Tbor_TRINITY_DN2935_c0_g1::TRINITY_DN2935_c0_g1_i2::g.1139::m.1139